MYLLLTQSVLRYVSAIVFLCIKFLLELHLLINRGGGIIKASFTSGNKDDRTQLKLMIKRLFGKVFGDQGYVSQELFQELLEQGIFMFTRVKKNMKISLCL